MTKRTSQREEEHSISTDCWKSYLHVVNQTL